MVTNGDPHAGYCKEEGKREGGREDTPHQLPTSILPPLPPASRALVFYPVVNWVNKVTIKQSNQTAVCMVVAKSNNCKRRLGISGTGGGY
jgi:hypothetical protein